ncbi:hypothetical protein AWJ14_02515 [Hoeflea olei]|uniref:Type-5 uracil-DNA glycosylase n=1 Tax=Hoeflea olei TaxID=1480615 RepID=A0A1C1YX03_9HYPH|nr:uracil-DNA glycosylase [Hoeflea olei]OCW58007.1 hypothetical protein AWJ14_02515 [Hoeflea olei]
MRDFILDNRHKHPDWHNGPVRTWHPPEGADRARLLVVGLAPGLRGANRTGIPFTGDQSGELLYATLQHHGLAGAAPGTGDGLRLAGVSITNAVRCVPPGNRPTGAEITTCRPFLSATIERLCNLEVILTLGKIAHDSTVRALGEKPVHHPFGHGAETRIGNVLILSSYHCSRYNINTGRLTGDMFDAVIGAAVRRLSER